MTRSLLTPLLLPFLLAGCHSKSADDPQRNAALAEQLVSCQNERGSLREQLAQAQSEARARPAATTPTAAAGAGADQAEASAPRQARTAPRRGLLNTPDVMPARPAVPRQPAPVRLGPSNPAAEAQAAQQAAQTVKSHMGQLRPCYERGLKRNANVQFISQVKVQLTASPDGHVRDVHISPRTEPDMESCMMQAITRWQIPPYKGQPVVLEVPVNLRVQAQ